MAFLFEVMKMTKFLDIFWGAVIGVGLPALAVYVGAVLWG